jgi:uncharacterized protein
MSATRPSADTVIAQTRRWVETAVVGLNLCPFARPEVANDRLRYAVCDADGLEDLLAALGAELQRLVETGVDTLSMTLLITPYFLADFYDYLDALDLVEAAVADAGLEGELQVASFHPDYRFEGEAPGDLGKYTNRSPYPVFHLLREAQVAEAIDQHPDISQIPRDNVARLQALGESSVRALFAGFHAPDE